MSTIVQEHPVLALEPLGHDVALKDYNHITVREIAVPAVPVPDAAVPDAAALESSPAEPSEPASSEPASSEPSVAGSSAGSQTSACESCSDEQLPPPCSEPVAEAAAETPSAEALSAETLPTETLPAETSAAETVSAESPAETLSAEALPTETLSTETLPAEPLSAEPLVSEPLATETLPIEPVVEPTVELTVEPTVEPIAAPLSAETLSAETLSAESQAAEPLSTETLATETLPAVPQPAETESLPAEPIAEPIEEPSAEPFAEPLTETETPPPPPQTHSALVVTADRGYALADIPAPTATLGPDEVMIRNKATGLNHIDWMSVEYNFCLPALPWVTGREMAGVVEAVGAAVTGVQAGDAVWTTTYYKDRRAGCFQELVVVPQHTVFPIPATLGFASAACLGVAGITAAMTLWQWLGVPMAGGEGEEAEAQTEATPQESSAHPPEVLLVWGGSTVTGQFAIQLAAQAGLEVVAVCSAATAGLVRSRGAAHVVTYTGKTDMHVIGEVLVAAGGRLTRAVDLVGARTARLVLQVIAAAGPTPVDFAPLAFMSPKDPVPANARVHTVEIKQFVLDRASHVYGRRLNALVAAGRVQLPAVRVLGGGLGAVEAGLAMVKEGNLEGRKLVISFGE